MEYENTHRCHLVQGGITILQDPGDTPRVCTYSPIGIIHSKFSEIHGMPIQPNGARGIQGSLELFDPFKGGLKDLEGFSRIILLYAFHRCQGYSLEVTPFLDTRPRGIFATRAPKRPNAIGLSIVRLIKIRGNIVEIEDVDVLDSTPLLDIKPYVPAFDSYPDEKAGWFDNVPHDAGSVRSDERFR